MSKNLKYSGISSNEAKKLQQKYGKNLLVPKKKDNFFKKILSTLLEPMFLLLIIASIIYFVLGEARDGAIMLIFVIAVITIDIIQEWKTDIYIEKFLSFSARIIRSSKYPRLSRGQETETMLAR